MILSAYFKRGTPERVIAEYLITTRQQTVSKLTEEEFIDLVEATIQALTR